MKIRTRTRKMKKLKSKDGFLRIIRLMKNALEGSFPFVSGVDRVTSWLITGKGIHVGIVVLRDISKKTLAGRATRNSPNREGRKRAFFFISEGHT